MNHREEPALPPQSTGIHSGGPKTPKSRKKSRRFRTFLEHKKEAPFKEKRPLSKKEDSLWLFHYQQKDRGKKRPLLKKAKHPKSRKNSRKPRNKNSQTRTLYRNDFTPHFPEEIPDSVGWHSSRWNKGSLYYHESAPDFRPYQEIQQHRILFNPLTLQPKKKIELNRWLEE